MTEIRPARRCSRRRAAWATAAFAAATVIGAPTTALAATSGTTHADEDAGTAVVTSQEPAPGTSTTGCALPTPGGGASAGQGDGSGSTDGSGDGSGSGSTDGSGDGTGSGTGSGTAGTLTWAPPRLTDPTTIRITSSTRSLKLSRSKDYILDLPSTPVRLKGGLTVYGGHNVVMIGGEIDASGGRAMYLQQQSGTVHVEGVRVTGTDVHEGINVAQNNPKAAVQLENIKIDQVNGSYSTHHADLLQVWAGPSNLRVDRFEGSSTYQGFFFQPTQFSKKARPDLYDLRNVVLRDASSKSAYLLWQSDRFPIHTQDVTVVRNPSKGFPSQVMWPKNGKVWTGVTNGGRSTASPLTGDPGVDYTSPGYRGAGIHVDPPKA